MKKYFSTLLVPAIALLTPICPANTPPAPAPEQRCNSIYYELFSDFLRMAEVTISMQDELESNPTPETHSKMLLECSRHAKSRFLQVFLLSRNPQLGSFILRKKGENAPAVSGGTIAELEHFAASGNPNIWTLLAGLASQSPAFSDLPRQEREKRMLHYLEKGANEGSACGMVSLAGTYLNNNTDGMDDSLIPDWCSKAIIALSLSLPERSGSEIPCQALRNIALNYLRRGKGTPELAATAVYLTCSMQEADGKKSVEEQYLLGELLRRLPANTIPEQEYECLMAYYAAAGGGHPAAMNTMAERLSEYPDFDEETTAAMKQQAIQAGYRPDVDYIARITTRTANIAYCCNQAFMYLLSRDELRELSAQAKKILQQYPQDSPHLFIGNAKSLLTALAEAEDLNLPEEETSGDPKTPDFLPKQELELSGPVNEAATVLNAARLSAHEVNTALALDALLMVYADANPEHKAIIRTLRLGNLYRTLNEYDAYGHIAAKRMLEIEQELGGTPGCTDAQRRDFMRLYNEILRNKALKEGRAKQ